MFGNKLRCLQVSDNTHITPDRIKMPKMLIPLMFISSTNFYFLFQRSPSFSKCNINICTLNLLRILIRTLKLLQHNKKKLFYYPSKRSKCICEKKTKANRVNLFLLYTVMVYIFPTSSYIL